MRAVADYRPLRYGIAYAVAAVLTGWALGRDLAAMATNDASTAFGNGLLTAAGLSLTGVAFMRLLDTSRGVTVRVRQISQIPAADGRRDACARAGHGDVEVIAPLRGKPNAHILLCNTCETAYTEETESG